MSETNHASVHIGDSEFVDLSWETNWKNLTIRQNDLEIGAIPDKKTLKVAQAFQTRGGKTITVLLRNDQLEIWCNGMDWVSGMATGSQNDFAKACGAMRFIGGVLSGIGILMLLGERSVLDFVILFVGIIYLILAWQAHKTHNTLYLKIGLGLLVLIPFGGRQLHNYLNSIFHSGIHSPKGHRLRVHKGE